jgi:hypothetical protein
MIAPTPIEATPARIPSRLPNGSTFSIKGAEQPAELGSPSAIGNLRHSDGPDRFGAGLTFRSKQIDLP